MRLFLSNLNYEASDAELRAFFLQRGYDVETIAIRTKEDAKSKRCFGFVEIRNEREAMQALESLNGQDFMGRQLNVQEAKPREDRPDSDNPKFRAAAVARG